MGTYESWFLVIYKILSSLGVSMTKVVQTLILKYIIN